MIGGARARVRDGRVTANTARGQVLNMSVKEALRKHGKAAMGAITRELTQMSPAGFDVLHPVDFRNLSVEERKRVLPSHLFVREKPDAITGANPDDLKARLVAGKDRSDILYDDKSSPTVSADSLKAISALAARDGYSVGTVDFPGAFLNCTMPRDCPQTYVRLNRFLTEVMVTIDERFLKFVGDNGTMVLKLNKALYGCVIAAKLWYDMLRSTLEDLGFKRSEYDMCVFSRCSDDKHTTLTIHVDDVKIFAPNDIERDRVIDQLSDLYPGLKVHRGPVITYLGMKFDYQDDKTVRITMPGYTNAILEQSDVRRAHTTPAGEDLYTIDEDSEPLGPEDQEEFHSTVCKLLYLSKMVRNEMLGAVNFLCSRVQTPTKQDKTKLDRMLGYLKGTRDLGLTLAADDELYVRLSVDASYGVHCDGKSHTGACISLGRGSTHATSTKQRIVTKASTEAELVAASDMYGQGIWTVKLLESIGAKVKGLILEQDNMSTIAMMKNGRPNSSRSRHISIRYFFIHDKIKAKEVEVIHRPSQELAADILTKPLTTERFNFLRDSLLGISSCVIRGVCYRPRTSATCDEHATSRLRASSATNRPEFPTRGRAGIHRRPRAGTRRQERAPSST